jgi:hypothetical protein
MRRGVHTVLVTAFVFVALALTGCNSREQNEAMARQEIEALLAAYLPLLSEAYAEDDPERVAGLAAPREVASIEKRLRDITLQGRRLKPTFRSFVIEDFKVWSYANSYVTTNEIWDIRTFDTGTDTQLTEQLEMRNRVKYQLKKIDGKWTVLFRVLLE